MPKLPETIWRRRLENEYSTLAKNQKLSNLQVNGEKTEYHFQLTGVGYKKNGDAVVPVDNHDISIYLSRDYPYAGGIEVIWDSPLFHPNVREKDGRVCIQLLNEWSESQTLSSVVDALVQLLENPNPASPLNKEAAKYFSQKPMKPQAAPQRPIVKLTKPRVVM